MMLLLSTSDTDLLSGRASGADWRLANPARLSVDDLTPLLADVDLVVVRLLGGRRAWPDGLDALLTDGRPVVVLSGEQAPDAALMELSTVPAGVAAEAHAYLAHGGPANLAELHRFLSDTVLLTGGSSLLPLVLDKVALASGKARDQLVCKQPHQAVAYGAAILAQQVFCQSSGKDLQSICSYDLGIRTLGRDGQPTVKALINRNSAVPASATMTFYTSRDDQTRMIIEAVQKRGEGDAAEEKSLGYFAFGPIESPRKKYPVEIEMSYDLEGMVTITARDPETGKQIRQVMDEETEALDRALFEQQGWLQKIEVNV